MKQEKVAWCTEGQLHGDVGCMCGSPVSLRVPCAVPYLYMVGWEGEKWKSSVNAPFEVVTILVGAEHLYLHQYGIISRWLICVSSPSLFRL